MNRDIHHSPLTVPTSYMYKCTCTILPSVSFRDGRRILMDLSLNNSNRYNCAAKAQILCYGEFTWNVIYASQPQHVPFLRHEKILHVKRKLQYKPTVGISNDLPPQIITHTHTQYSHTIEEEPNIVAFGQTNTYSLHITNKTSKPTTARVLYRPNECEIIGLRPLAEDNC